MPSVTHPTAVRDAIANLVVDSLDVGTTNTEGQLEFQTTGSVEVATTPLSNPSFGASSSGVATANAITDDGSATGGTTTKFEAQDRDELVKILGSVTGISGGGVIELTSTVVPVGGTVQMTSLTYTAPL